MKFIPIEDLNKPCPAPRSRKEILASRKEKLAEEMSQQVVVAKEEPRQAAEINVEPPKKKIVGPKALPCGHSNWYTKAELESATEKGFCCPSGGMDGYQAHHRFWMFEEQKTIIVPKQQRRSVENPLGVCADPITGLYIGLKHNDCRNSGTDKAKWCPFHNPKKKDEGTANK